MISLVHGEVLIMDHINEGYALWQIKQCDTRSTRQQVISIAAPRAELPPKVSFHPSWYDYMLGGP